MIKKLINQFGFTTIWTLFVIFIVLPVVATVILSFTYFNAIQTPTYVEDY